MTQAHNQTYDGIIAVWKPAGWTSHDVVAKVRRLIRTKRIGHTGTLDPAVTGVLPLCIGRATRVVEYVQELPKAYEAVLQFGIATDTEDLSGQVVTQQPDIQLSLPQIEAALASFVGDIEQVPPMFSAVSINGKRLYELARQGQVVERPARPVTIHDITLLDAQLQQTYPTIRFKVECSKGTYIRTLCVDIGRKLGVPAVMAELIRTQSGGFTQADSMTMEQIEQLHQAGQLADRLIAADVALHGMARGVVSEQQAVYIFQGKKIAASMVSLDETWTEDIFAYPLLKLYREQDGLFLGIFAPDEQTARMIPVKVFTPLDLHAVEGEV